MVIKNFLIHSKSIGKSSYLWNSASAMLNSFQTVVILMVISRIDPVNDAGIFVIAYAIGNLMLTIGRYGIRQFQASDVVEKYSYREYYYSRVLTTGLMLAISLAYIGFEYGTGQYDGNKSIVVLLICLVKWIDAFEDVFHGMLQQHDRLDIGGKILTVRLFLYTVLYMVLYAVTKDLILTSLISLLVSFALFVLLILSGRKGRAFFSKNRSYAVGVLSPVRLNLPDYVYWKRAQIRHRFRAFQPGSSQLQLCFYACFCHQPAEQLYLSAGFE